MLYGSCLGTVPIVSAPELLPVLMGDHWIPGLTLDTTFGNRYCSFIVCSFSNDTISDIIYWNKREKKNRYLVIYEKLKLIICFHVKIIFLLAFTHLILQSTVYLSTHMPVFFFFFKYWSLSDSQKILEMFPMYLIEQNSMSEDLSILLINEVRATLSNKW